MTIALHLLCGVWAANGDNVGPVISNIVPAVDGNSFTVTFDTDELADRAVQFWTAAMTYDNRLSWWDPDTFALSHSITLDESDALVPGVWNWHIVTRDAEGNVTTSEVFQFTIPEPYQMLMVPGVGFAYLTDADSHVLPGFGHIQGAL